MRVALYIVVLGLFLNMVVAPITDWNLLGLLTLLSLVSCLGLFWLHKKNPVQPFTVTNVVLGLFLGMVVAPIMDWKLLGFLTFLSLVSWLGLLWLHKFTVTRPEARIALDEQTGQTA